MDLRADLPRITAPILLIAGADDLATPSAHADASRQRFRMRGRRSSARAHLANVEQPHDVTAHIVDHLDGHDAR